MYTAPDADLYPARRLRLDYGCVPLPTTVCIYVPLVAVTTVVADTTVCGPFYVCSPYPATRPVRYGCLFTVALLLRFGLLFITLHIYGHTIPPDFVPRFNYWRDLTPTTPTTRWLAVLTRLVLPSTRSRCIYTLPVCYVYPLRLVVTSERYRLVYLPDYLPDVRWNCPCRANYIYRWYYLGVHTV